MSSAPLGAEIVLSKSSLAGICLITFACGIVTTVMVDRVRPRGSEHEVGGRDSEPAPAPAATQTAATLAVRAAPAPTAPAPADPLVVQMPNLDEATRTRPAAVARSPMPAAPKAKPVTLAAAAPAVTKAKPASAVTASPLAANAKPASPFGSPPAAKGKSAATVSAGSKKLKTAGASPATEWVDPFTQ